MSLLAFPPQPPVTAVHAHHNHHHHHLLLMPKSNKPPTLPLRISNPVPPIVDLSLSLLSCLHVLPSDFPERWRDLIDTSVEAERRLRDVPAHLIQAIVSSEDCRFFHHCGVDPFGVGRAVVNYPNGGGGSTITQQLMKRIFLSSERKMSRKFVEGLLSLIVETRMSKCQILCSYLSKMYWGHGIYGIESAAKFYFGKHPKFLDVGESALLAGILPGPGFLNPFTDPKRGKSSQIRVLRRMVAAGFLDIGTALEIASQPLCLRLEI